MTALLLCQTPVVPLRRSCSLWRACKWALEGFSQSLSRKVAGFGICVTLIEPGGYSTDWSGSSATHSGENPAYADVREAARSRPSASNLGDPTATRDTILKVVATEDYESRLSEWNEWQPVSAEAQGAWHATLRILQSPNGRPATWAAVRRQDKPRERRYLLRFLKEPADTRL